MSTAARIFMPAMLQHKGLLGGLCAFFLCFESATSKIISQKQPKTRLSSPRTPLNSHNSNNPNPIRVKKSLPDYPVHFDILKK
jgi:hypothetical protein